MLYQDSFSEVRLLYYKGELEESLALLAKIIDTSTEEELVFEAKLWKGIHQFRTIPLTESRTAFESLLQAKGIALAAYPEKYD